VIFFGNNLQKAIYFFLMTEPGIVFFVRKITKYGNQEI
jgi:hypothetical protein